MEDTSVCDLSRLIKVERVETSENEFISIKQFPAHTHIPNVVNVKIEVGDCKIE